MGSRMNPLKLSALWVWAVVQNTLTFLVVVPLIILGLFVVPVALLAPDDSQKQAYQFNFTIIKGATA